MTKLIVGKTDLATTHPELAKQWHPTKNGNLKPTDVTTRSGKTVWWVCDKGHEWNTIIASRTDVNGRKCPYCSSRRLLPGYNDLATTHPKLAREWHPTKNGDLKPTDIMAGSHKKVWWMCEKGHEWKTSPNRRSSSGYGCPYCSNQKVLVGYNDLATTYPELAKEWHLIKNGDLKPTDVTAGSHKKVWWMCEKGHEWQAVIYSRTNNNLGCPICANKKVLVGYNDLTTTHPKLAKQWHPTKNGDLKPTDVTAGSQKKVWWMCEKGHEWEATVASRTHMKSGCPICANKKVLVGYNDLATTHPELAKQWHPTKNGNLKPFYVTSGSHKMIWWMCERGHEWQASPNSRLNNNTGCPICAEHYSTSFPEKAILYYLSKIDNNVKSIKEKHVQWDIFISSDNTVMHKDVIIEYDGSWWHDTEQGASNDLRKNNIAKKRNILLYRVKGDRHLLSNDMIRKHNVFKYKETNLKSKNNPIFAKIINALSIEIYGKTVDVDTKRDAQEIMNLYIH